jgi:hypothetical protein
MREHQFALPARVPVPTGGAGLPRPAHGEHFLMGPIPLAWLHVAMALPGKALHVAVELWYLAGLRSRREVVLSLSRLAGVGGFDRATASRALASLEGAGLVRVVRHVGRAPRVEILERRQRGSAAEGSGAGRFT